MMPDNWDSSGMWCHAIQCHETCDVRLCSITLQKTDFSTNILTCVRCCYLLKTCVRCCYLLKNSLLTGLH